VTSFVPIRAHLASLKNLTSTLIGRFAGSVMVDTLDGHDRLVVPPETRAEIAVLKGFVAVKVMSHSGRQPVYHHQRGVLKALAETLSENPDHLETMFRADFEAAVDDASRQRVIVDQVASLTDQSAMALYERLGLA
jgi:dGTPase